LLVHEIDLFIFVALHAGFPRLGECGPCLAGIARFDVSQNALVDGVQENGVGILLALRPARVAKYDRFFDFLPVIRGKRKVLLAECVVE